MRSSVFVDPVRQQSTRKQVYKLLFGQLVGIVFITMIVYVAFDWLIGYTVILAGLASWLPSVYYAWRVFGVGGAGQQKVVLKRFFVGQLEKIAISVFLVTAVFLWVRPLDFKIFLISYIIGVIAVPLSLLFFGRTLGNVPIK